MEEEKNKVIKNLKFPQELVDKIEVCKKVPSYFDFTTKVFMLLEIVLADDEDASKKKRVQGIPQPAPRAQHQPRHKPQEQHQHSKR